MIWFGGECDIYFKWRMSWLPMEIHQKQEPVQEWSLTHGWRWTLRAALKRGLVSHCSSNVKTRQESSHKKNWAREKDGKYTTEASLVGLEESTSSAGDAGNMHLILDWEDPPQRWAMAIHLYLCLESPWWGLAGHSSLGHRLWHDWSDWACACRHQWRSGPGTGRWTNITTLQFPNPKATFLLCRLEGRLSWVTCLRAREALRLWAPIQGLRLWQEWGWGRRRQKRLGDRWYGYLT